MKKEWRVATSVWKPSQSSCTQPFREVLTSLHDHLEDVPPFDETTPPDINADIDIFVPARILAFVECRQSEGDNTMYAIVQTCESECQTDSLLTRRWKKSTGPLNKSCQVVEVASIACPCFVIESVPGFSTAQSSSQNINIVHEVFDRKTCWGKRFLTLVNRGISSACYRERKKELDQIAKKKPTPDVNVPSAKEPLWQSRIKGNSHPTLSTHTAPVQVEGSENSQYKRKSRDESTVRRQTKKRR